MTPVAQGFSQPAEWFPHAEVITAWPWDASLWEAGLEAAQRDVAGMIEALAHGGSAVCVLLADPSHEASLSAHVKHDRVRTEVVPFGDVWMRDIAPVFVRDDAGRLGSVRFQFNGWGGRYALPNDDTVGPQVQARWGGVAFDGPFVLEGGAVDVDGAGTVLTTRQCLLNPNRFPDGRVLSEALVAERLCAWLGARHVVWLDDGLRNDHTDGHVDTLARFVAPGAVVCMHPADDDDPNGPALRAIEAVLRASTTADGTPLTVHTVPSPGRVMGEDGLMPASYVNFILSGDVVVVPTYGVANDAAAVEGLAACFPGRTVVGRPARALLAGGGAFHCITQQVPEGRR